MSCDYIIFVSPVKHKFQSACHVTSRHVRRVRAHAFWSCRTCRTAQLDMTSSTRGTCRVVSRRDVTSQVEFGLKSELVRNLEVIGSS